MNRLDYRIPTAASGRTAADDLYGERLSELSFVMGIICSPPFVGLVFGFFVYPICGTPDPLWAIAALWAAPLIALAVGIWALARGWSRATRPPGYHFAIIGSVMSLVWCMVPGFLWWAEAYVD